MKKLLVVGVIILFLGMTISSSTGTYLEKQTIIATFDGNTLYVGGIGPGNYSKIQKALDDTEDGDTVFVYSGTYYENVIVNNSINLIGEDKNITIIDGQYIPFNDTVFINSNGGVTISGFTIKRCGPTVYDAGIDIWNNNFPINNNTIVNNIITLNNMYGIRFVHSDGNTVSENIFTQNDHAIWVSSSNYNNFHSNYFNNNGYGFLFSSSYHNTINNSQIINANDQCGVWIQNCQYINISNNNISGNKRGGIDMYESDYINVSNNIINNNGCDEALEYGVTIRTNSRYNVVRDNIINENRDGVFISDSRRNLIIGNHIENNCRYGISIKDYEPGASNTYNQIYHNNLLNNPISAYDEENNSWDNGYPSGGNWWSDYTGEDNDEDGIGDTPYSIPGGDNQDNYPFMEPIGNYPPDAPIIDGPTRAKASQSHVYNFTSEDPNGDKISYYIEWGDDFVLNWTDYMPSGIPFRTNHGWAKGTYTIRCKSKDIFGVESDWSELEVSMPKSKSFIFNYPLLSWLLEKLPIFQKILDVIGFNI